MKRRNESAAVLPQLEIRGERKRRKNMLIYSCGDKIAALFSPPAVLDSVAHLFFLLNFSGERWSHGNSTWTQLGKREGKGQFFPNIYKCRGI